MKPIVVIALLAFCQSSLDAATTVGPTFTVNTPVPDNSAVGLSNTQWITSTITHISEVNVQIVMSGGWSGDLYGYLAHDSGFAVLLNRPGRSLLNADGSGVSQLSVFFSDGAATDIHNAIPNSGVASGFFQPDARTIDPANSLDTSSRTAFLSSFHGLDANGEWTLFLADVATGETMFLESWSLTIQGVPEPATAAMAALGIGLILYRRRRG